MPHFQYFPILSSYSLSPQLKVILLIIYTGISMHTLSDMIENTLISWRIRPCKTMLQAVIFYESMNTTSLEYVQGKGPFLNKSQNTFSGLPENTYHKILDYPKIFTLKYWITLKYLSSNTAQLAHLTHQPPAQEGVCLGLGAVSRPILQSSLLHSFSYFLNPVKQNSSMDVFVVCSFCNRPQELCTYIVLYFRSATVSPGSPALLSLK